MHSFVPSFFLLFGENTKILFYVKQIVLHILLCFAFHIGKRFDAQVEFIYFCFYFILFCFCLSFFFHWFFLRLISYDICVGISGHPSRNL